ncbi:hypothetical protein SD70_15755 [Gordoniibacillus kamchatkensis]|uniref:Heparin-sulfate lyase N-terminal domain-containing protein n=1 Tax=Gordoniibacillus kamchatkensis TaxID=1590651 RepID=A0ABR5AHA2_9BACL|nr:alginate lyase family protein [Paenibacillus sp. VKM B-2647]KIL40128.1 hypothetical protein SD70_15755 [Paenibacillus sp. VKM B-2647]
MASIPKFRRLYETTRHLSGKQIAHRITFMSKRKIAYPFRLIRMEQFVRETWRNPPLIREGFIGLPCLETSDILAALEQKSIDRLEKEINELIRDTFTFINKTHRFSGSVGWNDPQLPHLWRYNLHYFNYAVKMGCYWHLRQTDKTCYEQFKRLIIDWIEQNSQLGIGDGWHPYTISLRLVNWTYAYELFKPLFLEDRDFKEAFANSYFIQALFLYRNIEWDVMGNHLIENGRALVCCGLFLDHPLAQKFYSKGLHILWGQVHEQILKDGGHYERSPMYHQIVLRDYLETIQLLRLNRASVPEAVLQKVRDMVEFQNHVLHPDGEIPLLNDSAFGIAANAETLRIHASSLGIGEVYPDDKLKDVPDFFLIDFRNIKTLVSRPQTSHFSAEDSGYYIHRSDNVFLIADAGAPSPDFLPAHAHADFGSFELSLFGNRWIVDSGTYQYQGEERNVFRGTSAHNCLTIDGENQTDVYGSFRMAKRAKPLEVECKVRGSVWALKARHDGYGHKKLYPTRLILVIKNIIVVLDELDAVGQHLLDNYIHFDPGVKLTVQGPNYIAERDGYWIRIIPFSSGVMNVELLPGQYSPEFNVKVANLRLKMTMPVHTGKHYIGYVISLENQHVTVANNLNRYEILCEDTLIRVSAENEFICEVTGKGSGS